MNSQPKYNKVILKISGEVLGGEKGRGLDDEAIKYVAREVAKAVELGVKIGIVCGGGNILRGINVAGRGGKRVIADHIGMIATVVNGMALAEYFKDLGISVRVFSSFPIGELVSGYSYTKARDLMNEGTVLILSGGTGNPFFSTDTAAVLRGAELEVDAVLKATKVDGVYDKDPKKHQDAKKFNQITLSEVLEKKLGVMDLTASSMALEHKMPIIVFNLKQENGIRDAVLGKDIGTLVIPE